MSLQGCIVLVWIDEAEYMPCLRSRVGRQLRILNHLPVVLLTNREFDALRVEKKESRTSKNFIMGSHSQKMGVNSRCNWSDLLQAAKIAEPTTPLSKGLITKKEANLAYVSYVLSLTEVTRPAES